jgi:hypothetical protein
MSQLWGMWLPNAQTFATHRGRILVHHDPRALADAFPGVRVVPVDPSQLGRPMLKINEHPDIAGTNKEVR